MTLQKKIRSSPLAFACLLGPLLAAAVLFVQVPLRQAARSTNQARTEAQTAKRAARLLGFD